MFTATEFSFDPNASIAVTARGKRSNRPSQEQELSESDRRKIEKLRETDQRVRRHEEAHRAAAGSLHRGGPTYTYETGPDGKRYAVAGSVQIDTSPGRTPQETIQKAAQIRRAALAPPDPSSTDRSVAAKASRMEESARRAIAREMMRKPTNDRPTPVPSPTPATPSKPIPAEAARVDGTRAEPATTRPDESNHVEAEVWDHVSALSTGTLRRERDNAGNSHANGGLDLLA